MKTAVAKAGVLVAAACCAAALWGETAVRAGAADGAGRRSSVYDTAVAWYRGAVDADGSGQFVDSKGLRDVLHANDSSHFTHDVRRSRAESALPIERMDVHCPYRNATLKDVPCLVFPQSVVTNEIVESAGATQYVCTATVNHLDLPNFLKDYPAGMACSNYTFVIRFRRDAPLHNKWNSISGLLQGGFSWTDGGDCGFSLVLAGSADSPTRKFRLYAGNTGTDDCDSYREFPRSIVSTGIPENRWVDCALTVEGGTNVWVGYSWDSSSSDAVHSNRWVRWWRPALENGAGIAANRRSFVFGGENANAAVTYTNTFSGNNNDLKVLRGALHQFAFWTNALTKAEVCEAFGAPQPLAFGVGMEGAAANVFRRSVSRVSSDGAWEELDTTLTADSPECAVDFFYGRDYDANVSQILRIMPAASSGDGVVDVAVNGRTAVRHLALRPGRVAHAFVEAAAFKAGSNVVAVTRTDKGAAALVLDRIELGGGWQRGTASKENGGMSHEGFSTNVVDLADGNMDHFKRGYVANDKRNAYTYVPFRVPADVAGRYDGEVDFHFVYMPEEAKPFPFEVLLNGEALETYPAVEIAKIYTIHVPAERLSAGDNLFTFHATGTKSWANGGLWRFQFLKPKSATLLLFR